MGESSPNIDHFIREEIDSVPHLEALLLLWRTAPQRFSSSEIASHLYILRAHAESIAEDLQRRGLLARETPGEFFCDTTSEHRNELLERLDATYRRDLIRISGIIHSKASPGIRAFADAFRFRKDKS